MSHDRTGDLESLEKIVWELVQPPPEIQEVSEGVKERIGAVVAGRAASTCFPVDDCYPVVVHDEVLGLEVAVQVDHRPQIGGLKGTVQIAPPRSGTGAWGELAHEEFPLGPLLFLRHEPTSSWRSIQCPGVEFGSQIDDLVDEVDQGLTRPE